jgi:propionyl-CoA carboxylase beta chain
MVEDTSYMFITGPDVVRTVTSEEVTKQELGGAQVHSEESGVSHFESQNEEEAIAQIRELLSFVPSNNADDPPRVATDDPIDRADESLMDLVPQDPKKPYDMTSLIEQVADDNHYFEVQKEWAKNITIGFARFDGRPVGVVANQPQHLAGCLDIDSSVKAARFVRFCDSFNIPLLTFVDVPGFLPGVDQEYNGIIRHGAKLLYAFSEATVPKITFITRKAYGGAYDVMSSKHIGADLNYAFPTAEIAVMGPDGAVNIVFREELENADNPDEKKDELVERYRETFANPFRAAELGYIDEVIKPTQTRERICTGLELLENKRDENPPKKHGNIPL